MKRINSGVYQYTTDSGLIFHIVRVIDADSGSHCQGMWYFDGGESGSEGGHDHYSTKKAAFSALLEYIKHRRYVAPYGWCYVPEE